MTGLLVFTASPFCGIAFEPFSEVRYLSRCFPRHASVSGSPRMDFYFAPIRGVITARLAVGKQNARRRFDDSWDAVGMDTVQSSVEQSGLSNGRNWFVTL
jgi:hypothetical protein